MENPIEIFIQKAFEAGMPREQLENFLRAKYVPFPWQLKFHAETRAIDKTNVVDIGVGGARGPGKSHCVFAQVALDDCQRVPGLKCLFLRQTGKSARESFEDLIGNILRNRIKHEYNISTGTVRFPNHSRILLGGFENDKDIDKYVGIEYDVIAVEELNQITQEKIDKLKGSLRTSKPNWKPRFYASFNPGGMGHCVPYGEVLTRKGWKDISKVRIGDMVATSDEKEEVVYAQVEQTIKEDYHGEIYSFRSATGAIECTPNHKIVRRTETKTAGGRKYHKPSLIKIRDISEYTNYVRSVKNWKGKSIKYFEIFLKDSVRKRKLEQPKRISGNDYCELMGWFLSEGYTLDRDREFGISQSKLENRKIIEDLLIRCGFKYRRSESGFSISSIEWWEYFKQFGKCRDKRIPLIIKNASSHQLKVFRNSAMLGDGCGSHYYTTSKTLADDMQEIGLKLGLAPRITSRQRENRLGLSYDVNFRQGRDGWLEKNKIKKINYSGEVYCLGVPKLHRFFIRQNGIIWLSGNSWIKEHFVIPQRENREIKTKFFPATYKDNPCLNKEYIDYLNGLTGNLGKAWREGNWDIFEGQYFNEWNEKIHTCEPFEIPDNWMRYRSYDHGRKNPACCLWHAIDFDGRDYVYRELYVKDLNADEIAHEIVRLSAGENYHYSVADPSIFSNTGFTDRKSGAETIAEVFANNGIMFSPASNRRVDGWNTVHRYLAGERPQLQIFKTCYNLIRTFPVLIHDEHQTEDLDSSGEDHAQDSLRYFLQTLHERKSIKPLTDIEKKMKQHNKPFNFTDFYLNKC